MADCVVVPSIAEGFGYNVVESNTLGTPVVASDAGSIPEVISGNYILFRSKDTVDLAEKIVQAFRQKYSYKKVSRFEWSHSLEKYLATYQQFINK